MTILTIPVCDIKPNNKQDLILLLKDIEPYKDLFAEIVILYDSVEWDFRQYFLETFPWANHDFWNQGKSYQFTRNSNQGLRYAHSKGEDCWLINQDVRLPAASLLAGIKGEGIVSTQSSETALNDLHVIKEYYDYQYEDIEKFAFYCTYFSKNAMDKTGFLDSSFRTCFSDDDFCLKCHLAGLPVQTVNIPIFHAGSYVKPDEKGQFESHSGCYNNEDLQIGLEQYKRKWSIPEDIPHANMISWVKENFAWDEKMVCE